LFAHLSHFISHSARLSRAGDILHIFHGLFGLKTAIIPSSTNPTLFFPSHRCSKNCSRGIVFPPILLSRQGIRPDIGLCLSSPWQISGLLSTHRIGQTPVACTHHLSRTFRSQCLEMLAVTR